MRYLALATDYDGTLAEDGRVPEETIVALERLRASGRRALMATGRHLDDLLAVCPRVDLFDFIVSENGAVAYDPHTQEESLLAEAPPPEFLDCLAALGVPFDTGRVIVSTSVPYQAAVLSAIQQTGIELNVVFNRSAVMVLPPGVNKATGLEFALRHLGLTFRELVGVGDAENDHFFLKQCECAVAVRNAQPSILRQADFVTEGEAGYGVAELIGLLLENDLAASGWPCRSGP